METPQRKSPETHLIWTECLLLLLNKILDIWNCISFCKQVYLWIPQRERTHYYGVLQVTICDALFCSCSKSLDFGINVMMNAPVPQFHSFLAQLTGTNLSLLVHIEHWGHVI